MSERRRSPRIEILDRVHGQIATLNLDVRVCEMSLGGLSMETSIAFPPGAVHEFRLVLGDGSFVHLPGRIAHCREITTPDGQRAYVTGVQFVDEHPADGDLSLGDLVHRMQ